MPADADSIRLGLERLPTCSRIQILPSTEDDHVSQDPVELQPQDVGVGISQVVPVIVTALDGKERLVAIEQPELHLHPALQVNIAELFIHRASQPKAGPCLIETHSEHMLLRLLRRIRETAARELPAGYPGLKSDQVSVVCVEKVAGSVHAYPLHRRHRGVHGSLAEGVLRRTRGGVVLTMLHEFAIDPSAVSRWEPFRYLTDHCGAENGRLIARLPKRWEDAVLGACTACGAVEKHRITERLKQIKSRLTRSARPYNPGLDWLRNAEDEHARRPFQAIVSTRNPNGLDRVLLVSDLDEGTEHWNVPRELHVPREAGAMAASVEGLFAHSKELLFVDPHFAPEAKRYRDTLSEFIAIAHRGGRKFAALNTTLRKPVRRFFSNRHAVPNCAIACPRACRSRSSGGMK